MLQTPLVSIIIPSYNYALFLPETLDSVMSQSFNNWECIVVDDGSSDNTKDIVYKYTKLDSRIKYVYQNNRGLSASRNTGVLNSQGKYIQLLDADDLIEFDKLKVQVEFLESNQEYSLVYGTILHFINDNNKIGIFTERNIPKISGSYKEIIPHLVYDNIFLVSAPLFNRNIFASIGYFNESLRSLEDWDFWFRYILHCEFFYFLDCKNSATLIRSHSVNMSSNHKRMWEAKRFVRYNISTYLTDALKKNVDDLVLISTMKKNNFLIVKDKGLFDICFGNWISGFFYTSKAALISFNPIREFKDALYWFKYRIFR